MNDGFAWWLVVLGIAIGIGLAWLILGRLPRSDADVDPDERALEADWISRNIAEYGGVAPPALVEEILELHRHYLDGPALDPDATARRPSDDPSLTEVARSERVVTRREAVVSEHKTVVTRHEPSAEDLPTEEELRSLR